MNRDMLELDVGKAILTSYEDGFPHAQFDAEGGEDAGAAPCEMLSPFGHDGRPRDPEADTDGVPGVGATAIRAIEGRTQHILVMGDPRATEALPQLEKGSGRVYAHLAENKVAYLTLDGSTGNATLRVPVGNGESTVTVNASTGDITLTHQGGTLLVVKSAAVEIGAAGGQAVALAPAITTWAANVNSALSSLGQPISALAGHEATKAKAT